MIASRIIPAFLSVLLFSGCLPPLSIHPYYLEDNVIFDEALLGRWVIDEENGSVVELTFKKGEDLGYEVIYKEGKEEMLFEANLFEWDQVRLLDFYPKLSDGESHRFDLLPMHTLFKLTMQEAGLHIVMLDSTWLIEKVKEGIPLEHTVIKGEGKYSSDDIILSGDTSQLQEFLKNYVLRDKEAFEEETNNTAFLKKDISFPNSEGNSQ